MDAAKPKDSPVGQLVPTDEGQRAFVPAPAPRRVELNSSLVYILDRASRAAAKLAGMGETLPNPHLLIRPFLRREAVLSSRIEGTQASISDLFLFEAPGGRRDPGDAREVANYVQALERGLDLLQELPLCIRLVNETHARLLEGARGQERAPGELRTGQNWIGPRGTPIQEARFVPPPASLVPDLLSDWERFVNDDVEMPPLVQCALMHYQFEAIHPYFDGNGRIGRLLIILFLCVKDVLPKPLLYLSDYFDRNRGDYYDHLYNVSLTGNWEPWLRYFLEGVAEQAQDAVVRAGNLRALQERYRAMLQEQHASSNVLRLLDELFVNPYVTVPGAHELLRVSRWGAKQIVARLVDAGILESLGAYWPRIYVAKELLKTIEEPVTAGST